MPDNQTVTIEVSQTLQAFVLDENGKQRAAAKLKTHADGRIQIWLAGRDPVTVNDADLAPLTALLQNACSLLPGDEFDPSDPEPSQKSQDQSDPQTPEDASRTELTIEPDESSDDSFELEEADEF